MKSFFGLCLIAVVLSVGDASRYYRGALTECTPGQCLVRDGQMCRCGDDGSVENAQCISQLPPYSVRSILSAYTDVSCTCTPGEKFNPNGFSCTCPDDGVLTPANCAPAARRSVARRRSNAVRAKTFRSYGCQSEPCEPNACVVNEGKLCACGENGEANPEACWPSTFRTSGLRRADSLCTCEPAAVFDIEGYTCTCPEDGAMIPDEHCVPKRSRYGL